MKPAWNHGRLMSGGGQSESEQHLVAKQRDGYAWQVVTVYDTQLGREVQALQHVSGERSDDQALRATST